MATPATHGYSGTPLPRKLGIKEGMTLALVSAPIDFPGTLGELPAGVTIRQGARGSADLAVETDLSDGVVREIGLGAGLVDSKTCAIDATFSGLRFTRRRTRR